MIGWISVLIFIFEEEQNGELMPQNTVAGFSWETVWEQVDGCNNNWYESNNADVLNIWRILGRFARFFSFDI